MVKQMNKILDKMDENFVDNYKDLMKYKNNFDNILHKFGFEEFESYNKFCINIKDVAKTKIRKEDIKYLDEDTTFFSEVINETLRDKIKQDKSYEKKIMTYFGDEEILDFIKGDQ